MANLIGMPRAVWKRQPNGLSVDVNWTHPSAKNLVFLALPTHNTFFDYVTRTFPDQLEGSIGYRLQNKAQGKSSIESAIVGLVTVGGPGAAVSWPTSSQLRGGNIVDTGTLIALAGSIVQSDGTIIQIGGNTEYTSTGDQPMLGIDSYASVGRGNVVRTMATNAERTASASQLLGNPFSNQLHYFGFAFDSTGTAGDFFGGDQVQSFTSADSYQNTAPSNRRARLFNGTGSLTPYNPFVACFSMWDRRMSPNEYLELYKNPWQLFKPRIARFISIPSAGPVTFQPAWARPCSLIIGSGV